MRNENRQWLLQRITRTIFYRELPECDKPECEDCKQAAQGIKIWNQEHARKLDEWCVENDTTFTDVSPSYLRIV